MFIKSKINVIDKIHPIYSYTKYENGKYIKVKEDNFLIKIGDVLKPLDKVCYEYKDGFYYVVKIKNSILFIDDCDCQECKFSLL